MRSLTLGLVCSILLSAGCSGSLGSGGSGGTTASGTGGSATGGRGGAIGTGGTPGAGGSPGTVTLQVVLPSGETFCDENASCSSTQHLTLTTASGQPLALNPVGCGVSCASCAPIPCPEVPVIACPAGNYGVAVTGSTFTWDGTYSENDACEPTGASVAINCVAQKIAAPGTYVAQFCATPGTLSPTDGGGQLCTPSGASECGSVEFTFPSSKPVVISLPDDRVPPQL